MISSHGGYHTHFPPLAAAMHIAPPGPILEVGTGHWSTVLMHLVCVAARRPLISLESDATWLDQFRRLESTPADELHQPAHRLVAVDPSPEGWTKAIADAVAHTYQWGPNVHPFALAFVDHAPESERKKAIEQLRPHTAIFVMHDTDPEWNPAYDTQGLLSTFRYRWDFAVTRPMTTIFSDLVPLPFDERAALPTGATRP